MTGRLDPLVAARQIEASYKRYLKTLLAPRDPAMAAAFDGVVDETTALVKGPLLELTPPYEPSCSVRGLVEDGVLHPRMLEIGAAVDRPLYRHQEQAIRKVVAGRNLVVSTGTGSGKTESFLYPILDSLLRESAAGTLGPGVRALLLYPMNALANDQLARLREVLAPLPEITFGRYTGETKERTRDAEALFRQTHRDLSPLPNEMISRDQMRAAPPHLLLTNYAMLEYLLLRPADIDLFDGPYAGTWRFIALDEAHVYDGAQGSEVALLLRRLRQRVAPQARLRCIATSASLDGDPAEAMTFASNLFDAPFEFDPADPARQDLVQATRQQRRTASSWRMTDAELRRWSAPDASLNELAARSPVGDPADALHREELTGELEAALAADGPKDVRELQRRLWPDDPAGASELLEALVALGSRVADSAGNPVLSARYHLFVRATEGAFVSFTDRGPRVRLARHERDPETGRAVFEFGTCQRCGAVHLAGEVHSNRGTRRFLPATKEGARLRWLVLAGSPGGDERQAEEVLADEDEEILGGGSTKAAPQTRLLCTGCGYLGDTRLAGCPARDCPGGQMLRVREHKGATSVMSSCTECGARARQVIRQLRTDGNAAPAVITTALYQQLPPADDETAEQVGDGRKLLMFSDSRQAAAFAAPYLDRTYGRALERRYLVLALQDPKYADDAGLTVDDLAVVALRKATDAQHFPPNTGRVVKQKAAAEWVVGELIALDQRQSLEGLGLLRVALDRAGAPPLPRAFGQLGLTVDETWDLLDELARSARLQGALTLLDEVDITAERFEPRNVRVRIRSRESDRVKKVLSWLPSGRPGTTNNRIRFVTKVLRALDASVPADKVLDECWKYLLAAGYLVTAADKFVGDVYQLDHSRLQVSDGRGSAWFRCDTCRRLGAFDVRGACPNSACAGTLRSYEVPAPEVDEHHYRTLYESLELAPLAAKEHTAQWQSTEAAKVQREFVDGRINVLSCSTTFELGVDVGALQSVVLRNMPPKTANYVQRAGRAGRRAASAALVLTYAKRSSHDLAKFAHPHAMIAGQMRIPWVPIENERIGRRHAHSVALAAYFRYCWQADGQMWKTAGEFFRTADGGSDSPASRVGQFLTPVPDDVAAAVRAVLPVAIQAEIGIDTGAWVGKLAELLRKAQVDIGEDVALFRELRDQAKDANNFRLAERIQRTLNTIEGRQLFGYLANKNILPKYGFPVDTVELRTAHCPEPIGASLDLARDLSQAIYDYAPGNQIVAGGKVWTSRGLHRLPDHALETLEYQVCSTCKRFECDHQLDPGSICPSCEEPFGPVATMVVPEFGFVAERQAGEVGTVPPQRMWNGASYVEKVGDEVFVAQWPSAGRPTVTVRAGARATLAVVSDGRGGGFELCDWCGWAAPIGSGPPVRQHDQPQTGRPCSGPKTRVSLAHRYQTDVAEFTFDEIVYHRDAEAQWLSTLYALLEGASESLEISRDDIDGALSWSAAGRRSIVLFDTVPAGAGAAKQIAQHLPLVLRAALDRMNECECGAETSCYGCLRSYRNAFSHDQLSRAAALTLLNQLDRVAVG
ncbi:DEAD/DEAH box helicase [Skermania piniformis]|uniref:DEAD/DEAH box helicase n=1 Tax=Skermania pinensis TaxID=39122 RepID=A0ABX8SF30_9ACTN|nr:DEAD/DEAH box helicase [Skermania piniformis]QXQ15030.1 DEAD/DEAH box helicase [Skermania piniformis]